MIQFKGFPAKMQFTPIPNIVFSSLLPQITDIIELKVLLHIFEILYPKKGMLRFISFGELLSHPGLIDELKESPKETLQKVLDNLVRKEVILQLAVTRSESKEDAFFLNTEPNRLAISRIEAGEIIQEGFKFEKTLPVRTEPPSDIFTLYEQNIGMLTPLIADELKEAIRQYPETWI